MDIAQRYRTAFQARISLSAGRCHRRGVTDPFHIVRFGALQGLGERPKVGVRDEYHLAAVFIAVPVYTLGRLRQQFVHQGRYPFVGSGFG